MSKTTFELLHPGVKEAIWRMGWKEFHAIQIESIEAILQTDRHVILCAPTAGGKTEAAFLPVISRLAEEPLPSIQAIYIGPLKALINDQFQRLETLCEHLDIAVHRWHGDVPANKKKALREKPSGVLLITPESLESNFINYGSQLTRIYHHLQFVVIDELHSLLDNVRGVHLRSLLCRLTKITAMRPRLIGLSATLADPAQAQRFLAPDNPETVKIITDTEQKKTIKLGIRAYLEKIEISEKLTYPRIKVNSAARLINKFAEHLSSENASMADWVSDEIPANGSELELHDALDDIAEDIMCSYADSTNLVFINQKSIGEELADRLHQRVKALGWPHDPFMVHHGSLSKDLREETEGQLRNGQPTTAICSSTLELGIDIGSIRAVAQISPPWSVSSLVQRLGRSGRRPSEPSIMRMYVIEDSPSAASELSDLLFPDLLRAIAMTRLMLARWLEPADLGRMHLSTLIHQILSCLKQTGGMYTKDIFNMLVIDGPFRQVKEQQYLTLLRGLGAEKLVEQVPTGEIILTPNGERVTGNYDFYCAFQTSEEYSVRYKSEEIGMLPAHAIPAVGEHLLLAGKRWLVEDIIPELRQVRVTKACGKKAPIFHSTGGEIHTRIYQEMKVVLSGNDEPAYLDQNARDLLRAARKLAKSAGIIESDIAISKGHIEWFPWLGTRSSRALALFAEAAGIKYVTTPLSIQYKLDSLSQFKEHLKFISSNDQITSLELARLMKIKTFEKYDSMIPEELLDFANAQDRIDFDEARDVAKYFLEKKMAGN